MATLRCVFVCLCSFFLFFNDIRSEILTKSYDSEISAVLQYLNSQPYKVYNYREATLLSAHKKADIIELALDVHVACINSYPEVPCTERVLACGAFVKTSPEGVSQVLNEVSCKPKPEIIVEDAGFSDNPTEAVVNGPKSIALSNEAVSSEVGEPFVAIRRNAVACLGCPFDLNVNAEGVDELIDVGLEHVGSERDRKQALVRVLRVQQQVVSGVKYFLLLEIAPTVCTKDVTTFESCPIDTNYETSICQIIYLQKPWISKAKHVISNNCTTSQEYVKPDSKRSDLSNEIDSNDYRRQNPPNFDHMAATGAVEQMTPARLSDLESQILVENDFIPKKSVEISHQAPTEVEIEPTESVTVVDEQTTTVATELEDQKEEEKNDASEDNSDDLHDDRMKRSGESPESDEHATNSTISELRQASSEDNSSEETKARARRSEESAESLEAALNATMSPASNSSEDSSSEEKTRPKRAIPQLEKITPEEKSLVRNLADFAAAALDNIDDDNHRRIILQILGAKKMVGDDGVYYHLIMRMGISRCLEDKAPSPYEDCREKLIENYTKICKVQVYVSDDFSTPKIVKSQCQNIKKDKNDSNRTNYSRFRREVFTGGRNEIDKNSDKVKELLKLGVNHLNSRSSKTNKYKPVEVVSATSQVVAGSLYRILVKVSETDCSKSDEKDLEDCNVLEGTSPTMCQVKVWEKSWENFRQFTINCENGENLIIQTKLSRRKRQIPGGPNEISKGSDKVKELLSLGLPHLDAKSSKTNKYKPVEVISATSQVVAGSLYRIKVKLTESDCAKNDQKKAEDCNVLKDSPSTTCEIKVWEKSWENFRKFTITCENGDTSSVQTTISRKKRSIPGGHFEVTKDDENVMKFLEDSLKHLDSVSPNRNKYKIQEILLAKAQVVSGYLYRIRAKIVESDCKKHKSTKRKLCGVKANSQSKTCDFVIHDQPWIKNGRQTNVTCEEDEVHSFRSKRDVGNHRQVYGDDDFVENYLESGLKKLDEESLYDNKYRVDKIMSVTKQAVAGHVYHITAKVVLSNCKKEEGVDRKMCGTLEGAEPQICKFRIFEAVWKRGSRTINVTCDNDEYTFLTEHRGLLGNDNRTVQLALFSDFLQKYNKKYLTKEEFKYRFKVFTDNLLRIRMLNTYEQGTAWYGVTKFADMTQKEFSKSLGLRTDLRNENDAPFAQAMIPNVELPTEFDWRNKGAVTKVKNQEQCGSCWAFSVTGNVEGQYAIRHGKLLEFSEQELVDCDSEDQGCDGGLMDTAYRQIEKLGGLESEQDYPYEAEDERCHFNRSLVRVQLTGAVNISHNETDMAKWLVANGPISIAINANAMQFYIGGVSHPLKFLCSPKNLDHGVLIVGYGVHTYPLFKKTLPYWIVKNSWGTSWGEQGYYRVYRGDGTCGLNQTPSSAIVA